MPNTFWPHGLQHTRLSCPSLCPGVCSDSCPLIRQCYLTTSASAPLFSFRLQSFPASTSFPMSWFFTWGGQSIGASALASVLPMNIQGWFPLGLTRLISLLSKGLSRVFFSTTTWKHQIFRHSAIFMVQPHICTWLLEKVQLSLYAYSQMYICFLIDAFIEVLNLVQVSCLLG